MLAALLPDAPKPIAWSCVHAFKFVLLSEMHEICSAAISLIYRCSEGTRVGWNDELLGFDCGGQQWVLETAFPAGTLDKPDGRWGHHGLASVA
jgi:hypothetical protein